MEPSFFISKIHYSFITFYFSSINFKEIIVVAMFKYGCKEQTLKGGETKMTMLIAKLIASLITYGIVAICGVIALWSLF